MPETPLPLGGGITALVTAEHRFGSDAVLLADFAWPKRRDIGCDLGTGCGILPLLGCRRDPPAHIDAVELQPEAAALAAEAVFAVFRYRRWTLGVTLLSAVAIGIVYNFYLLFFYYQAFPFFSPRGLIGTACELLSAVVFAGFGSWVLYRALAKSGVLTRFASGR